MLWRPILVQELFTLVRHLFGTTCRCLSIQPFQLLSLRNIWRHISLTWPFPHRYRIPHGLLMLRNCFLAFAVEHWLGCRGTEPGFAGDIGAIEVWLIEIWVGLSWGWPFRGEDDHSSGSLKFGPDVTVVYAVTWLLSCGSYDTWR